MNIQEELKELKQRISELEQQEKQEKEFPQKYDDYWYVDDDTEVLRQRCYNSEYDEGRLSIDNVFKTKEQAEFVGEKLKVEAELRKFSRPFNRGENNYIICIGSNGNRLFTIGRLVDHYQGAIYFESAEKAEEAIEVVGEERIKKYIFRVED